MFSPNDPSQTLDTSPVASSSLVEALEVSKLAAALSCTDDRVLAAARDGLTSLCALLNAQPRCRAQTVVMEVGKIRDFAGQNCWLLCPEPQGWSIISSQGLTRARPGLAPQTQHGSQFEIDGSGDSRLHEVIVVEVDTGLGRLRRLQPAQGPDWFRLWRLIRLERRELASLLGYAIFLGGLSLAVPAAVQVLVNSIAMAQLVQPLVVLSVVLFAVLCLDGITKLLRAYSAEILARRLFVRIAEDICLRLPKVQRSSRANYELSERSQRFFETITIQKSLEALVLDGLELALSTVAGLALLAFYHPLLLAFDLMLILGFVLVAVVGRGALVSAEQESRSKYRVAAWIREVSTNADHFAGPGGEHLSQERADELILDYLRTRKVHYRKLFRQLMSGVGIYALATVALLGLGGHLVMQGELSLGQLVAAELVVGMVLRGFTKVGKHLEKLYDLHAALGKVGMIVDLPLRPMSRELPRIDRVTLAEQTLGAPPATLSKTELRAEGRYLVKSGNALALCELQAGLRGFTVGTEQKALKVWGAGQDLEPVLLDAGHLARSFRFLEQGQWSETSILDRLRVCDPSLNEATALIELARVELAGWVQSLEMGVHTPFSTLHSISPQREAALLLLQVIVTQPSLVVIGNWLDSSLIAPQQKARLREIMDRELESSIILEFSHCLDPELEHRVCIFEQAKAPQERSHNAT